MRIGPSISFSLPEPGGAPAAPPPDPLAVPQNLFTAAQAAFNDTAHIDFRGNWEAPAGILTPLLINNNDARINFAQPLTPGTPYAMTWDVSGATTGTLKAQFGGSGSVSGRARGSGDGWMQMAYFSAAQVAAAYPRCAFKPGGGYNGSIDNLAVYDLSATDPTQVVCDVVLCLGDSNMSNAVSEFATAANTEHAYDPRVWYMPCLRVGGAYSTLEVNRHIPTPLIEPTISVQGQRMSPIQAMASRLADRAAARGRPLLMLALGEPGAGLNGTEDWRSTSSVPTTGARMWAELQAMLAALGALGPAHEIVGAAVSLGANDTSGVDYDVVWTPQAVQFVTDLRAETGIADLPIVWAGCAEDYEQSAATPPDRVSRMRAAQASLDESSGSGFAVPGVRFVASPAGNLLGGDTTQPHFTAHGMQVNGRAMGDGLLTLLG